MDLSTFLQKRIRSPKNILARIALSVNGAVIHAARPVVARATAERGKIIPRQQFMRLKRLVKKGDSILLGPHMVINVYLSFLTGDFRKFITYNYCIGDIV